MKKRLIDKLMEYDPGKHAHPESLARFLGAATVIVADNVAQYYLEVDGRNLTVKDLPNIAPPFDNMFIEWKAPKKINENGVIKNFDGDFLCYGSHIISYVLDEKEKERAKGIISDDVKWLSIFTNYYLTKNGEPEGTNQEVSVALYIDSNGLYSSSTLFPAPYLLEKTDMELARKSGQAMLASCVTTFMAVSFMHCKNVEMISKPDILKQTRKRSNHVPSVKYYTLNIHPMKKILSNSGSPDGSGIKYSLHICRGHFKDYSKGDGLFGRNKGLYWWDSHVRGDPSRGAVVKDYKVNPPTEGGVSNPNE